jgi:hypothetical protein
VPPLESRDSSDPRTLSTAPVRVREQLELVRAQVSEARLFAAAEPRVGGVR